MADDEKKGGLTDVEPEDTLIGFKLSFPDEPEWIDVIPGIFRVLARPVTYVEQAAAEVYADRMMRQLNDGQEAVDAAGATIEKLPHEEDREAALRDLYHAQGLARQVILEWEGPLDEEGNPAAVTPENVDAAIRVIPYAGKLLMQKLQRTIFRRLLEGNGSTPLSDGLSGEDGGTAPDAESSSSPAAGESEAKTDSDAPSSDTDLSPSTDDDSST